MEIYCLPTILFVLLITFDTLGELYYPLGSDNEEITNSLVTEAYRSAKQHFSQGSKQYEVLKNSTWNKFQTFLDLVQGVNSDIGKEVRNAVLKRHGEKPFVDFMDLPLPVTEIIEYVNHCLSQPVNKEKEIRKLFQNMILNFVDVRNFKNIELCEKTLPDQVTTAQCIIRESIRLNDTMENSLRTVIITKLHQHVREMNSSIFNMQECFALYVPELMENLVLPDYDNNLQIANRAALLLIESKNSRY